ncbi:MAG TPA: sulfur transferase domain-containing protein [Gemmatimonadaceae bacterium]|nr:sulfur transferase domain-containing protein [Gemmatimonadaceae bacterium]
MRKAFLAALALVVAPAVAHAQKFVGQTTLPASLPAPVLLDTSGMFQARYAKIGDDLFIGGQPTERALREMKAQGVTTVINLRMPAELTRLGFDEAKLIADLGMKYVHIPMRGGEGDSAYTPVTLKKFADALKGANGKVLLHCTIAWRASHIWGAYLISNGAGDAAALTHTRAINLMDEHRMDNSGKQPIEMFLGKPVAGLGRPSGG